MPTYNLVITPAAERQLKKLTGHDEKRIREALSELIQNPLKTKFLHGKLREQRTLRVGNWRILYDVEGYDVNIYSIKPRDKAYR